MIKRTDPRTTIINPYVKNSELHNCCRIGSTVSDSPCLCNCHKKEINFTEFEVKNK